MVDIAKIEAEAEQVGAEVLADAKNARGWLKSAWAWAWNTSWKTKAVVGVILLTGLLCGMASRYKVPNYVTQSEANKILSERESLIRADMKTLSEHVDTLDAAQHQLDSRLKAVEAKPEPAKITTGSIPKKTVARKPARKPASSSNWFSLP